MQFSTSFSQKIKNKTCKFTLSDQHYMKPKIEIYISSKENSDQYSLWIIEGKIVRIGASWMMQYM